jgi:hypothetical protein
MSLEGATGAGKTTLMRVYASAFPRVEDDDGVRIPVLYLETPSPSTTKGMAAEMLEALGDPAAHRGTQWYMNSRLITLLRACRVELVILDDFQHLVNADTDRVLKSVSEWLKVTIKNSCIPFIVTGVSGQIEKILRENDQLSRLFATREELLPFAWHRERVAECADFIEFVRCAEAAIGLPIVVPYDSVELLDRVHWATNGIVANIMNLIRYAQDKALGRRSKQVEAEDLAWAYRKRLLKHVCKTNPFETVEWTRPRSSNLRSNGRDGLRDAPQAMGNRSRKRKEEQPSPSDLLHAR